MKQRPQRMAQIVRRVVSSELLKLLPQSHITVGRVEVSDDLRYADIWISSFAREPKSSNQLLDEVEQYHGDIQQQLNKQVKAKFVPSLRLHSDPGKGHADRV